MVKLYALAVILVIFNFINVIIARSSILQWKHRVKRQYDFGDYDYSGPHLPPPSDYDFPEPVPHFGHHNHHRPAIVKPIQNNVIPHAIKPNINTGGLNFGQNTFSNAAANSHAMNQNIGGLNFGSSAANANAFSQNFGLNGFGSSAANAQAQGFQSQGFGANAANAATQSFQAGPGGLQGSVGQSGSQSYNFGDKKLNVAYSLGYSLGPNGVKVNPASGSSISFT